MAFSTSGLAGSLAAFALFAITMGALVFLMAVLGSTASGSLARPLRLWGARVQPVAAALIVVAGVLLIFDGASHFFDALVLTH